MYFSCLNDCFLFFFCWISLCTFYFPSPPFLVHNTLTSLFLLPEFPLTFLCTCQGSYESGNSAAMRHLPLTCSYGCMGAFRCVWLHLTAGNEPSRQISGCVKVHSKNVFDTSMHFTSPFFCVLLYF
jgi:hypothetical protein